MGRTSLCPVAGAAAKTLPKAAEPVTSGWYFTANPMGQSFNKSALEADFPISVTPKLPA